MSKKKRICRRLISPSCLEVEVLSYVHQEIFETSP